MTIDQNPSRPTSPWRRWFRIALAILVLAGIVWFAYRVMRAISLAQQLEQTMETLQRDIDSVSKAQNVNAALPVLRQDLAAATATTVELRQAIGPFGGLLKTLTWVPIYGHDLAAVPPMLDMAESLLSSIHHLDVGLSPLVEHFQGGTSSDSDLVALLSQTITSDQEEFSAARRDLQAANAARQQISNTSGLHPRLQNAIAKSDHAMSGVSQVLMALDSLPDFLGEERPDHILILLQNADELRPTGGFITYTIYLVIDKGKITEQVILPSTGAQIDQIKSIVYDLPPEPMKRYMDMPIWLFRDANWYPDFPTSATKAAQLYEMGRQVPVDTVIALNQFTIQSILKELGPITLSDGTQLSDQNAVSLFQSLFDQYLVQKGPEARKDFIPELAPQLFNKTLHVTNVEELASRVKVIQVEAARGDLLIYSTRPALQGWAETMGFDGALSRTPGDYLYPVDTNIGVDKTDLNMERTLSYHVSLVDMTQPYAILRLGYSNRSAGQYGLACPMVKEPLTSYFQEADDCYVDYLRLYLAEDTKVVQSPTFTLPSNFLYAKGSTREGDFQHLLSEQNKEVYGVLMIVTPGETLQPSFVYQLSPKNIFTLQSDGTISYDLLVKRQPGIRERMSTVAIDLPPNSQLVGTTPEPTSKSSQVLTFGLQLDSGSLQIHLVLRLSPDVQKRLTTILPPPRTQPFPTPTPRLVPTDVPLPTPIPTTSSAFSVGIQVYLTDETVMRNGPGTVFSAISTISSGELVTVLGRDEPGVWAFVTRTSTGETGWVIAKLLSGLSPVSSIPLQPNIPDPSLVSFSLLPGGPPECQTFNWKPAALFRVSSQANPLKLFDRANQSSIEDRPAFYVVRTRVSPFLGLFAQGGEVLPNSCQSSEGVCARVALTLCTAAKAGAPPGSYDQVVGLSIGRQQHDQFRAEDQIDIPVTFQVAPPSPSATPVP